MLARSLRFLLPPLLLLCLTLPHLGQGDFRRDTVRYAAVGHYMFSDGDMIAPQLRPGVPYFNKPPIALWIHGGTLKVFGISLGIARLPSIAAAFGVVLLSMLCVRKLGSRSEAIVSGFALVLTYEFFRRTREISLDLWQLLFLMGAAYFIIASLRSKKMPIAQYAAAGGCIGLALLCKPLIGLGAFTVFALWLALADQKRRILPMIAVGLVAAAIVALPWHFAMWSRFGESFTGQYFGNQIVDRAKGEHGSEGPFFYLTMSEWSTYPWLLAGLAVWICCKRQPRRNGSRNLVLFGLTWALPFLIGLSLFADKKPNYALLIWPMLSWTIAFGLCRIRIPGLTKWHESGYKWLAPTAVVVAIIVALLPIDFQKGNQAGISQVLDWMRDNQVNPDQVAAEGLAPNDYCYLYLQSQGMSWPPKPSDDLPYTLSRELKRPDSKRKFRAGKYTLWKQRPEESDKP